MSNPPTPKFKTGDKVRINVARQDKSQWPIISDSMLKCHKKIKTISYCNYRLPYKTWIYELIDNANSWRESWLEPATVDDKFNTYLADKGFVTKEKGGFMEPWNTEVETAEVVLKRFKVITRETIFNSYDVQAESEDAAEDIVSAGSVNSYNTDYADYEINSVEEI